MKDKVHPELKRSNTPNSEESTENVKKSRALGVINKTLSPRRRLSHYCDPPRRPKKEGGAKEKGSEFSIAKLYSHYIYILHSNQARFVLTSNIINKTSFFIVDHRLVFPLQVYLFVKFLFLQTLFLSEF